MPMTSLRVTTATRDRLGETTLNGALVDKLRSAMTGTLLRAQDRGYEDACRLFNAGIERRPALIARCRNVADVTRVVRFAREHEALVSIRAGGHNVAGNALCDGGVTIDLSEMKRVDVDAEARTAVAEGGSTWADFDAATQALGLATTGGIFPTTGVAGLTLGGGIGYLNRKHGLACDNLLSAEVVTADGERVRASATEHEDLFWALRGGGGNFGVVTSFEFRVHPVGPVLGGLIAFPLEQAKPVLRFFREWVADAPDELRIDPTLLSGPMGPMLGLPVCYCGAIADGEKLLEPLRRFGSAMVDTVAPVPYETVQNLLTEVLTPGMHHFWKSGFLGALGDDAIEAIVDYFTADVPPPIAVVTFEHLGGAVSRVGEQETAFSHRHAQHAFLVARAWRDAAEAEAGIAWARGAYAVLEPFLQGGVYVNYLGDDEGDARLRAAYGPNYQRLVAVKTSYDPSNFFRVNQNIRPAR
jgi:FAD/FMN-containing dehydrogenase